MGERDRNRDRGGDSERSSRVYVGGLTDSVKKEDLETEFEKYGKLNSVWVAFNPPGFAFIEFIDHKDALSACDSLNGTDFFGSKLRVEIARGRSRRGGGSSFRGGRGSRGGPPFRSYGERGYRGGGRPSGGRYESGRRDDRYGGSRRDGGGGGFGRSSSGYGSRGSSGGGGGGGRKYDGSRYRSRSPAAASSRH